MVMEKYFEPTRKKISVRFTDKEEIDWVDLKRKIKKQDEGIVTY